MEKQFSRIPELFPAPFREAVEELLERRGDRVEELRLRVGQAPGWVEKGRERPLRWGEAPLTVEKELLEELLRRASGYAAYSVQEQLSQGYLTLPRGHRLGVCGTVAGAGNALRDLQSMNLRLASQRPGCADDLVRALGKGMGSLLILGPPGAGKTTLLRDLIRQTSDALGLRVGILDQRGELAACQEGRPQLEVGRYADVLTGCGKAAGIDRLLRTMNPQVIALDEITAPEDLEAMIRASYCGISFFATAHAADFGDLDRRPLYRELKRSGLFTWTAMIKPDRGISLERMKHGDDTYPGNRNDPGLLRVGRASRLPVSGANL